MLVAQKYNNNAICLTRPMKQLQFQCLPLFADAIIDMMIAMHKSNINDQCVNYTPT